MTELKLEVSSDAKQAPKRIALIRRDTPARLFGEREEIAFTAPHLLLREVILIQISLIVLALASLFFDAPLEEMANPYHTPNPAKSPWYFVGLQELLHYFPPVVAGVLLPALAVIAVAIIPYFQANLEVVGFYEREAKRRFAILSLFVGAVSALLVIYRVWPVLVPTLMVYVAIGIPLVPFVSARLKKRLERIPLADWIMIWFSTVTIVLTIIGALFRGPAWTWLWPWEGGPR